MALNFPDNPSINDVHVDSTSGFSYQWDGVVWKSYSPSSTSQIKILDDISGSFNGSTQTFSLTSNGYSLTPLNSQSLIINIGGIIQDPSDDYSISGSNITFSTPPTSGLSFSGVSLGPAVPISTIFDGTVTPAKLSTGGPTWNTSGGVTITGVGTTALLVNGNARVTGILTVGNSSITFDGTNNIIRVGTGLTLSSSGITGTASTVSFATTSFGLSGTPNLNVGVVTASSLVGNVTGNVTGNATGLSGTPNLNVGVVTASSLVGNVTGNVTGNATGLSGTPNLNVGVITASSLVGNVTGNATGLSGTPNLNVGVVTATNFVGGGASFSNLVSNETRSITGSEKLIRSDGNTVSLVYNSSTGANVGFATNPTNNITLNVTGIPTSSDFDNQTVTFAVIVNNTGTARTCTSITLNGVSKTIKWIGGSLSAALAGVTTTNGYTIFSFVGINTVGPAGTMANYEILGVVNGGFW